MNGASPLIVSASSGLKVLLAYSGAVAFQLQCYDSFAHPTELWKENELLIKAKPAKKGQGKTPAKPPTDVVRIGEIECRQRLGGLTASGNCDLPAVRALGIRG